MPSEAPVSAEDLDRKISQIFAGKVVRKELVRKVKFGSTVPVYPPSAAVAQPEYPKPNFAG